MACTRVQLHEAGMAWAAQITMSDVDDYSCAYLYYGPDLVVYPFTPNLLLGNKFVTDTLNWPFMMICISAGPMVLEVPI